MGLLIERPKIKQIVKPS